MKTRLRMRCIMSIALVTLGAGAGDALALDPYVTVLGGGVTGGGTSPTGDGYGGGMDLQNDPSYNFAASGNEHAASAAVDLTWSTAAMSVDVAPAGSGVNGLAINHAHFDSWVSDIPDGYGRGAAGYVVSQSSFASSQTQYYGALRWQVVVLPNLTAPPSALGFLNLHLMALPERVALTFGSAGGTYGDTLTAGPQQRSEGAYDAYMRIEAGANNNACGVGTNCLSNGGGRYLVDVWWAYSDAPIDPALLSPAPEPQTWALLLAGLIGISRVTRRCRQTRQLR
jgi:hypothetical protein